MTGDNASAPGAYPDNVLANTTMIMGDCYRPVRSLSGNINPFSSISWKILDNSAALALDPPSRPYPTRMISSLIVTKGQGHLTRIPDLPEWLEK